MNYKNKNTYFGTTVEVVALGGLAYFLWWLFSNWGNGGTGGSGGKGKGDGDGNGKGDGDGNGNNNSNSDNANKGGDSTPSDGDEIVFTYTAPKGKPETAPGGQTTTTSQPYTQQYDSNGNPVYGIKKYKWKGIGAFNNNRTDFITTYYTAALKAQKMTGIFPETMYAVAIIESSDSEGNFGQGDAAKNANNFFGIHADPSWTGPTYESVDGGQNVAFRSYPDVESSIADFYSFLKENGYYKSAFSATTPEAQLQAIGNGGYSTTPTWANSAISLLPFIKAAEKTVSPGDTSYTPTPTDVAVDTDEEVDDYNDSSTDKFTEDNSDVTWVDKLELFYLAHETPIKVGAGVIGVIAFVAVAQNLYKKNSKKKMAA